MKKLTLFALLILLITSVLADPLGITANIPDDDQGFWSGQRAVQGRPELNIAQSGISNTNNERWEEVSRIDFNEYLEAGKYLGVEYNPWSFQFNRVSNQSFVNNNAETAIARAPIWVQSQLRYTFSQLTNARQNVWATLILDTVSPYIDEVCYSIANSGPGYLARQDIYPEVMVENAELMYTYADEFQFVDIVEQGSEASGDWYTTTRYRKMDEFGIARWVEVDRDIHYMYNVHPKFTDEIPNYIDPEQSESNTSHANNFAAPPAGRFWREYLYYHNDTGYPQLRSMLANCQYVIGSPVSSENVINQLNSWINGSMSFTSDNERPHQPIRIYDKHIGRCGEYQDLRGAVARIALVPVKGINCISGDHVWNEFWDERWIHWDGAIDNPLLYENGWGRHYGSIFEQRSDGKFIPVSDRYSDGHATLNIWAVDVDNRPIDGASVYLRVDIDGEPYFDNIGVTDDNGLCVFIVGEDRKYYARVNSVIQNMPSSGYDLLVENASNNAVYDFTFQSTQAMSVPEVTDIPIPDGTGSLYKVVADFSSDSSLIIGNSVFDDASGGKNYEPDSNNGAIDFYMTDSINYAAAMSGLPFSAFNSFTDTQNGSVEFLTNNTDYWYSLLFNRHNVSNPKHVQGSFIVYTTDADYLNGTLDVSVADMYGNPVSGTTVVLRPNNLSFEVTGDATSLTVPQGTYDIYCYPSASQPNYLPTYVQGYSITAGETAVLEFTLLENANPAGRVIAIDEGTQVSLSWDNTSVNTRDLDHYSVYRGEANSDMTINDGNLYMIEDDLHTNEYLDTGWTALPNHVYLWVVIAYYTSGEESTPAYSNPLALNMTSEVVFNLMTNVGYPPLEAQVILANDDGDATHRYEAILEGDNIVFPEVWQGTYNLTITFESCDTHSEVMVIDDDCIHDITLNQTLDAPTDLAVMNGYFSWFSNNMATGYNIYLDGVFQAEIMGTNADFTSLTAGVEYTAGVEAIYSTGVSEMAELAFIDGSSFTTDLVANYSFDGDATESINGIDLTPYGTIEYSDDAINGQSVVLDGFSSYLESANSPILNDTALSYTIKVWVKPRIQPVTWAGLVGKPGRNYQIWTHPNGYIHHRFHTTSGTNSGIDNTADGVMNWGQWNCVVITNDGTVGKTYVNGVLESSGTINGDLVADDTPLIFGRHLDGESINNMLDGLIDECTIWNRALGQNELVDLYMDEMIPAGIVQGTIENNDNDPIAYATVEIGSQTIIADALGAYFLYVQPGDYTHTVSAYGYADNTQDITVLPDGDHVIDVMLTDNMDAPDGLSVQNFEFNWNPVELDNRDFHGYHVYLDGNLLGTSTDTTHTFSGLNPDQLYMAGVDAIFTAQTSEIAEIGFVNGTSLEYMNTLDLPLDGDYSEIHGNTPTQILGDLEFRSDDAYDNYLYFHGVNDYLEMLPTDIFGINQSSFTANAWVKLEHDDTNDIAIFGTNFSGATNGGLHLVVRPSRIGMRFYGNDTNVNYPLLTDVWYQITYNYDMDAMTQTIYLNGEQIGQGTNKTPFDNQGTALLIGQADGSRFFTGGMRNIGIWNRSLNQNEIVNLFNDTKPDYGYIVGTVLRAEDNEPMQGVTVTVGEIETMTNSDGYYTLPIVAGTYTVGFRPGLHTEFTVENVSVMIGQETVVDYLYDFTANDDPTQPLLVNALTGLYPNPFNPTTTISFTLKEVTKVEIKVYDIRGRLVRNLLNESLGQGNHHVEWDGMDNDNRNISSGIYFVKMSCAGFTDVRKAVLLK